MLLGRLEDVSYHTDLVNLDIPDSLPSTATFIQVSLDMHVELGMVKLFLVLVGGEKIHNHSCKFLILLKLKLASGKKFYIVDIVEVDIIIVFGTVDLLVSEPNSEWVARIIDYV